MSLNGPRIGNMTALQKYVPTESTFLDTTRKLTLDLADSTTTLDARMYCSGFHTAANTSTRTKSSSLQAPEFNVKVGQDLF
jgi:hypothetical protein